MTIREQIEELRARREEALRPLREGRAALLREAQEVWQRTIKAINDRYRAEAAPVEAPFDEAIAALQVAEGMPGQAIVIPQLGIVRREGLSLALPADDSDSDGCGSPPPGLSPVLLDGED